MLRGAHCYHAGGVSRSLRIAFGALFLIAALPLIPWVAFLAGSRSPPGLRVAAEPIAAEADLERELALRARRWRRREVAVDADDAHASPTREDLGANVDARAMRARIETLGRTGNPFVDLPDLLLSFAGETDLGWEVVIDRDAVRGFVDDLAHRVDRPARPARFDARGALAELSADGARLERDAAVNEIVAALAAGRLSVRLPVTRIPSGVGDAAAPPLPPFRTQPVLLARYTTDFRSRGSERPRAHNVETAASYLDGALIPPHGRLSFNDRVGARSVERGYRIAHVIRDGEMVDGLGGGVCQVASTLHAAAFLGGLDIREHVPHSRPSEYIPMGLDATVVWPNVDLVIANPHPFPITVRARGVDGQMVVELYGARRPARVEWHRQTLETADWSDRYVEDPEVPEGRERVSQRGIRGYTILRERTIHDASGVHIETRRLRYPPTDRIIRVPPGTLDPLTGEPNADGPTVPENPF